MGVVFDNDANLPGIFTEVLADYNFGYDTTQFGTTDSVAIIGTAFNGPNQSAVPIFSKEHAAYVFGRIYDNEKKEESSLVAGICDAWDRGARTIYAVRVGGKELYKDFNFCVDNGFKLRVSSRYPSNTGKDCYLRFSNMKGNESISFYKPAERATIVEKRQGAVKSEGEMLVTEINLGQDRAISYNSPLVDMITTFNEHPFNNVLHLSIVDENGNDVTGTPQAYSVLLGAMYPGVYFIGRNKNTADCAKESVTKFCVPGDGNPLPFSSVGDNFAHFNILKSNTDVAQPLPIYYSNATHFRTIITPASISMVKDWDFLKIYGVTDRAWKKDSIDYEETGLTPFEIYQRLGQGYAITAHAVKRINSNGIEIAPKIEETPADNPNKIVPIKEGLYENLQNMNIKYRVLVCANADQEIPWKMPRAKDFKKVVPVEQGIMPAHVLDNNGNLTFDSDTATISLVPKIAEEASPTPLKYKVEIEEFSSGTMITNADIYMDKIFDYATRMAQTDFDDAVANGVKFPVGSLIAVGTNVNNFVLYRVDIDGNPEDVTTAYAEHTVLVDSQAIALPLNPNAFNVTANNYISWQQTQDGKPLQPYAYSLVMINDVLYVMDNNTGEILGDYSSLVVEDHDDIQIYGVVIQAPQEAYDSNGAVVKTAGTTGYNPMSLIKISSEIFNNITVGELVDIINSHKVLSKFFTAELTNAGIEQRDNFISVTAANLAVGIPTYLSSNDPDIIFEDRETIWDYNSYIPYRTTDNFARQLAQHCTYTELKTAPAFGIIGCERMANVRLSSIAKKVSELLELDFDLYAKTDIGRYMLDANNLAYPIGRNLTIVFDRHKLTVDSLNYTFISNGAAAYGGMVSTLPIDQSSTAQPINLPSIDIPLTEYQLSKLTAKGILTFRDSFTKGIVVTDGITMAPSDSVFRRLNISRITGAVEEVIRIAAEPFIGKQNHQANRNALNTAIKANLDKLIGTLIEKYMFTMNTDPKILKFNYIDISYEIIPIYEIREVRNTIKITDSLSQS